MTVNSMEVGKGATVGVPMGSIALETSAGFAKSVVDLVGLPYISPPVIMKSTPDTLGVIDTNNGALSVRFQLLEKDGMTPVPNTTWELTGIFTGLVPYTTYVVQSHVEVMRTDTKEKVTVTRQAVFTTMPEDLRYAYVRHATSDSRGAAVN